MAETAKERVLRQYGAVGDAYVRSAGHAGGNDLARLIELVQPAAHERMLDIATGGGHVAKTFAPHVAEVVASDLTPEMLAEAEKFILGIGIVNVSFVQADAEDLPFDSASFEIVTCRIAPHHFPHPERFVAEVARVLRPGGRFGLIDSVVPSGELGELYNRFEAARDPSHVRSLATEEWVDLLVQNGLTVRAVEHFPKRHDFVDWTDRARVTPEGRDAIARILLDAGPAAADVFHLEIVDGKLVAFTDDKALFLAESTH
jgi:ubiquinone/menaquinone biosynthesis C-methylase UbiE